MLAYCAGIEPDVPANGFLFHAFKSTRGVPVRARHCIAEVIDPRKAQDETSSNPQVFGLANRRFHVSYQMRSAIFQLFPSLVVY